MFAARRLATQATRSFHSSPFLKAGGGKEFKRPLAVSSQTTGKQSALSKFVYENFLKKTSSYFAFIGVLAWVFDYTLDVVIDGMILDANKGRSFSDVIASFPLIPPNCEVEGDEE